ncbi:MAG: FAD-dependent oxidoreductase [Candidatus Helarchaeota archaeon]|nr:FAD-dependent oxidoreductase [Candidatus Helarchaeota archaeon]
MKETNVDVAVIGGGPAGLAAAIAAKEKGVDVLIIERDFELGGILPQCIHNGFGLHVFKEELTGPEFAQRYINRAEELKILVKLNTMVTAISPEREIMAVNQTDGVLRIKAKTIILAMGCRERTRHNILIPGTRPAGIYPAGLAQRLVNIEGYMPGKQFVILGSGDIGMIMARRLTWEGAKVEAVVEILPYPSGLIRNQVQCLKDYGIPLILEHTVTRVHGEKRVEGVTIARVDENWRPIPGTERFFKCDTLLLSVGLIPENELSRGAGIEIDPRTRGPQVTNYLETNIPGIFACGNVLQVHDLVDNVALEGSRAGEMAVNYVHKEIKVKEKKIQCIPGEMVGYVVPQFIHKEAFSDEITFFMRAKKPQKEVYIEFKMGAERIHRKFSKFAIPSEMIKVTVPVLKDTIKKFSNITVNIVPKVKEVKETA